jgi:hypothetical protein
MSSGEPSTADLSPDYELPWANVFEDLVKFLLYKQAYVKTRGNEKRVEIKSEGYILGKVLSGDSNDECKVNISFLNIPDHLGYKRE